eukprot:g19643.t1
MSRFFLGAAQLDLQNGLLAIHPAPNSPSCSKAVPPASSYGDTTIRTQRNSPNGKRNGCILLESLVLEKKI